MRNRMLPEISEADAAYARSLLIHEDAELLVFNKPTGLAVQGGRGLTQSLDGLLVAFAKSNGKKPRLVHRLDRGTSGLIIVARTKPAAAFLSKEFSERRTKKTYLALVEGDLPQAEKGEITVPLARVDDDGRARMIPAVPGREGGQAAMTRWKILDRVGKRALLEVSPITGRMHQLRVHLSASGCPIVGDEIYGQGAEGAARLMLHAWKLEIRHPSGAELRFQAPVPDAISQAVKTAGLKPA